MFWGLGGWFGLGRVVRQITAPPPPRPSSGQGLVPGQPFRSPGLVYEEFIRKGGGGRGGGGWHKALVVGSVSLWQRLLASRP